MNETTTASEVVTRTTAATARPKGGGEKPLTPVAIALWTGAMVAGVLTLAPIVQAISSEMRTYALQQADDAEIRQELAVSRPAGQSADYYESLSELALQLKPADKAGALKAARMAIERDPSRGFAWATIAYLESDLAGSVNPASIEALRQSIAVCPLCSTDLIRWRFNFILGNWPSLPEDLRRKAFEEADLLRWTADHAEFLAEMRAKAVARGIAYDAYRAAVKTPARTWDIDTGKKPAKTGPAPKG